MDKAFLYNIQIVDRKHWYLTNGGQNCIIEHLKVKSIVQFATREFKVELRVNWKSAFVELFSLNIKNNITKFLSEYL